MKLWSKFAILLAVAIIASVFLGKLLELAVLQIYPSIDPIELDARISLVLSALAVLGLVLWFRR